MDPKSVQQMADQIGELLMLRLGASGHGLRARIASRSRALPRKVRRAALGLAEAEELLHAPRIARQMDARRIEHDYRVCRHYLEPLGEASRWAAFALNVAAMAAGALVLAVLLVLGVAHWRGLL